MKKLFCVLFSIFYTVAVYSDDDSNFFNLTKDYIFTSVADIANQESAKKISICCDLIFAVRKKLNNSSKVAMLSYNNKTIAQNNTLFQTYLQEIVASVAADYDLPGGGSVFDNSTFRVEIENLNESGDSSVKCNITDKFNTFSTLFNDSKIILSIEFNQTNSAQTVTRETKMSTDITSEMNPLTGSQPSSIELDLINNLSAKCPLSIY